jgi:hypothetical protein
VVATGNTNCICDELTLPIPLSMEIEVAPVTAHSRVEVSPAKTTVGYAVKLFIFSGVDMGMGAGVEILDGVGEGADVCAGVVTGEETAVCVVIKGGDIFGFFGDNGGDAVTVDWAQDKKGIINMDSRIKSATQ